MAKRQHPELEGHDVRSLYTFEFKKQGKRQRDRLLWSGSGLLLGLAIAIGTYTLLPKWMERSPLSSEQRDANLDAFQEGIQYAMQAAQDTQTAEFKEDWVTVAMLWRRAIAHMEDVSSSDPNYAVAKQKVDEYGSNLQYAQSNIAAREANNPDTTLFWSPGSSRSAVIAIEGTPSRIERYDALCKETLYYGESSVELVNGYVSQYDDINGNLSVLVTPTGPPMIFEGDRPLWTLGSSQADVLAIEGPPTRIEGYESLEQEFYYYNNAWIEFDGGIVTGYHNQNNAFHVSIGGGSLNASQSSPRNSNRQWSLGASRDDVLNSQPTIPTQINRNNASCKEMIYYGASRVEVKNGVVSGYDNVDNVLRVR